MMTDSGPKAQRVKTGCLNCRKRHKKCDEVWPSCTYCAKRNLECQRPTLVGRFNKKSVVTSTNFKAMNNRSQNKSLGSIHLEDSKDMIQGFNTSANETLETNTSFVDDRVEMRTLTPSHRGSHHSIVEEPFDGHEPDLNQKQQITQMLMQNSMSPSSSLLFPEDNFLMYNDLHDTLRDFMLSTASTTLESSVSLSSLSHILNSPPTESTSTTSLVNKLDAMKNLSSTLNPNVEPTDDVQLSDEDKFCLFQNYIYEVAPWLDMFDTTKQFGSVVPDLAKDCDALMNAIYAISSRQQENVNPTHSGNITVSLYRAALKSLIPSANTPENMKIVTACVILCVFEMMSSSPDRWRHHLEGCALLFKSVGLNGFGNLYERSLFWCYARMDVDAAVVGENPTIIPSYEWLPKNTTNARDLFLNGGTDMYANYSVFLSSRVLNLQEGPNYQESWNSLWLELNSWYQNRPKELTQVLDIDKAPFPLILYRNGPAISANQVYHMLMILMISSKPRGYKFQSKIKSDIWHAKQIVSISLHNNHHGCWNNALQPLWIAGKFLSGEKEQRIILNLLLKIEKTTGWIMKTRLNDLKRYWSGEMV